jgi:glycopeptide antibiotics resistance protein
MIITDEDRYLAASQRLETWLLASYAALILAASLYPFNFDVQRFAAAAAGGFLPFRAWQPPVRRDLVVNLLAYVPLGLLGALVLRQRVAAPAGWLAAVAGGAALSLAIELLQHGIAVRVPSVVDFLLNTISSAIGATLASLLAALRTHPIATRLRRLNVSPALGLLIVIWLAAHAVPFLPRLRPGRIRAALDASLALEPTPGGIAGYLAAFLLLSAVLRTLVRRETFWPLFILVTLGSLCARLLFVGQRLLPDEYLGLALALPLILLLRGRSHAASQTPLFGIVCCALLASALAPFTFDAPPAQRLVTWIPFAEFQGRQAPAGELGALEHVFLGVGAVWLAASSRFGLLRGTLLLLGIAACGAFGQYWLPARVPGTTDIATVLGGALVIALTQRLDQAAAHRG